MQNFYIDSQSKLRSLIEVIRQRKIFAMDTEFTRETTYYPILSIIQVAVKNQFGVKQSFIIDCLCDLNLEDFFTVVADPEITKILHSSSQDLQIFYHKSAQLPQGVVDTQIMANFCGFGFNVGYSNLVSEIFQKHVSKDQQRSNWQARPLSQKQIEYALLDVFFLEEIHDKFYEILLEKNRSEWFVQEMQNFIKKNLLRSDEDLIKKFPMRRKSVSEISKIKKLILWREAKAREINVPRQHLLQDFVLEKIVSSKEIGRGFSAKIQHEIREILDTNDDDFGKQEVPELDKITTQKQKEFLSEAKSSIAKIAAESNFCEQFLLTNSDLKKISCCSDLLNQVVLGWRYELFGEALKQILNQNEDNHS